MDAINLSKTSMADSVRALYDTAHKVISVHARLNALAMSAMQSLGYNGFKRWHRCRAKELFALDIELANEFIDRFRIKGDFKEYELSYSPSGMEEHLKAWEKALLDGIQTLGEQGKAFYELTGMKCGIVDRAMRKLSHDYEKTGRYIRRFSESDWLALDMHIVDDRLHDRFKKKEEGDSGLWKSMMDYTMGKKS
jgi:hypothetical protein